MPSKPEDQPQRPAPAVGQVWQRRSGVSYAIIKAVRVGVCHKLYFDGDIYELDDPSDCVGEKDTYIGRFAGFKVEGE